MDTLVMNFCHSQRSLKHLTDIISIDIPQNSIFKFFWHFQKFPLRIWLCDKAILPGAFNLKYESKSNHSTESQTPGC